jgi:hypothetical protein
MTSMLPKDAAELHAIAQELVGQDADYIEEFLRDLLAEFAKSSSAPGAWHPLNPLDAMHAAAGRTEPRRARCLER